MKTEVKAAKTTQSAMPEIGKPEKTMYYIVIGENDQKIIINTGEKTYNAIKKMEEASNKK